MSKGVDIRDRTHGWVATWRPLTHRDVFSSCRRRSKSPVAADTFGQGTEKMTAAAGYDAKGCLSRTHGKFDYSQMDRAVMEIRPIAVNVCTINMYSLCRTHFFIVARSPVKTRGKVGNFPAMKLPPR